MLKRLWQLILRIFNFKAKEEKVPQGVQIFDENENVIFDAGDHAARFCGVIVGGTAKNPISGTVTIDPQYMTEKNEIFYIFPQGIKTMWDSLLKAIAYCEITVSGNSLTYKNLPMTLYYGIR